MDKIYVFIDIQLLLNISSIAFYLWIGHIY